MRIIRVFICFIMVFCCLQPAQAQNTDQQWYLVSKGAFEQERYKDARTALTNIDQPEPYQIRYKAKLYLKTDQPDSAIHILQDTMPETSWLLALAYAQKNNAGKAMEYLRRYLQSDQKRTEASIKLHEGFSSINHTQNWDSLWLKDWYSHHEKTIAEVQYLMKQGDYFAAIDSLTAKIEHFPEYAGYQHHLSVAYEAIGKYSQALKYSNRAVELEKSNAFYRLQRGRVYARLRDWDRAVTDFNHYLRTVPDDFDVYRELADAYAGQEDYRRAIQKLDEYLRYLPHDPGVLKQKAGIASQSGDYLTALTTINMFFEHHKSDKESLKLRGLAYYHANMARYAERDLSLTLDFTPNDAEVYYYRAMSRIALKKTDAACGDLKKAFQLGYRDAYNKYHDHCEE